jgi:hypothetical protein
MRKSRVLLAGVAVAGAAVATTAFTAGNTFDQPTSVVGYGEVTVTGIHVTTVTYNRLGSDNGVLDNVEFATDHPTDISGLTITMTLKDSDPLNTTTNHTCGVTGTAPTQVITCAGDGKIMSTFETVGLTVGGA